MIRTPTAVQGVKTAIQLERAIFQQLDGDPKGQALFLTYVSLVDSLAGGLAGEQLLCSYDEMVQSDIVSARAVLGESDTVSVLPADGQFSQNGRGGHLVATPQGVV
jgi:hypothetical protein